MKNKLGDKQLLFCKEYLVDLNATQAAIRAGYSKKTAYSQGQRLLKNVEVKNYIDSLKDKRSEKLEIAAEKVLEELAKMGFANIQKLYDKDGRLLPVQDLPEEVAACLQEVTEETVRSAGKDDEIVVRRKYKIADKKRSLELLGKHLKLFTDKREISNSEGAKVALSPELQELVDQVTKRADDAKNED